MEKQEKEIRDMIARQAGSGDIELWIAMLDAYIAHSRYNRFSEDVYENPQRLQHWNGYEAGFEQMKHDIQEIVNPS